MWDSFPGMLGVAQRQTLLRGPLICLQQGQHLTKDLGGTAAVYLLNHDHEVSGRFLRGVLNRLEERTVHQGETAISAGTPAPDKVLVGEVGVELVGADPPL